MTFGELKATLAPLLMGESRYKADNATVKMLLKNALYQIATECEPLVLLTDDFIHNKTIRQVDEKYFIREPSLPKSDDDELDIDGTLGMAVVYLICAQVSKNPLVQFAQMAQIAIDKHRWGAFEYLQNRETIDELHNVYK